MQQFFTNEISVNFNLRQTRKNRPTIVYCVIFYRSKRIKINTLVKVLPQQWNAKKQLAVISPTLTPQDNRNNIICNDRLLYIRKEIEQKLLSFSNYYTFVSDIIKIVNPHHHSLAMAKKQSKRKVSTQPQASADSTTATGIIGTMVKNDTKVKLSSYEKTYSVYIRNLENFLAKNKIKNELKMLTYKTISEYALHLEKTQTSKQASTILGRIKAWLKDLGEYGVGYKFDANINSIKVKRVKIGASKQGEKYNALTHEQIYSLYNLTDEQLSDSTLKLDKLKFYRDMFVMQCFCGCRACDIIKLFDTNNLNKNSQGEPFIEFWAKKTEDNEKAEKCVVPLTLYDEQLILFEKYKNTRMYESTFTGDSDNAYNKHIHEICRIAGGSFNTQMKWKQEIKGGKVENMQKRKYECITSQDARHSFITNCVRVFGLLPHDIIHIVGHGSTQYIEKVYLNLTTTDVADKITRNIKPKENTVTVVPQQPIAPPQPNGVHTSIIKSLNEGQKVLAMLGVEDVQDIDTIDEVITQICVHEHELKQMYGDKLLRGNIKQVFNSYATTAERKKALQELIDEIQKED